MSQTDIDNDKADGSPASGPLDLGRRRFALGAVAATAVTFIGPGCRPAPAAQPSLPPMRIGINIGALNYWTANYLYADLARQAGPLRYIGTDGGFHDLEEDKVDARGWPLPAPAGTRFVLSAIGGVTKAPPGPYRCRISKGFDLKTYVDATSSGGGQSFTITPKPDAKVINLVVEPRSASARLDEFTCMIATTPVNAKAGDVEVALNSTMLDDLKPFPVLRFMDLMRVNNAPRRTWANRTLPDAFTQAGPGGMAIEHLVALANVSGADPWFTLPYDSDDDYYRRFAELVKKTLDPSRTIYLELSNEVWNSMFEQSEQAAREGMERNLATQLWQAADRRYAQKAVGLFQIWMKVFADQPHRIVRVLGSQAANAQRTEDILSQPNIAGNVDAVAIAPYFGGGLGPQDFVAAPGSDRFLDELFARGRSYVDTAITWGIQQKAVASRHGVRLITYEGGQHFFANAPLEAPFMAANQDPRMGELYTYYLGEWQRNVGDLLVLYLATGTNVFGMRSYTGQPLSDAPKMKATLDFIKANALR